MNNCAASNSPAWYGGGREAWSTTPSDLTFRGGIQAPDTEQVARLLLVPSQAALRALARLPSDWDGCGSDAPRQAAVSNASARLPELFRAVDEFSAWRVPHISANEIGDVTFEWWHNDRKITLYFGDDAMRVVYVWGSDIENEMSVLPLDSVKEFAETWDWLHGE